MTRAQHRRYARCVTLSHIGVDKLTWIEFTRSDGDPKYWPVERMCAPRRKVTDDIRSMADDEPGTATRWRLEVAAVLAPLLKLPSTIPTL